MKSNKLFCLIFSLFLISSINSFAQIELQGDGDVFIQAANDQPDLFFRNAAGTNLAQICVGLDQKMHFSTSAIRRMTITAHGQVGIGTIAPDASRVLHVTGGYMLFEPTIGGMGTGNISFSTTGLKPQILINDGISTTVRFSSHEDSYIQNNLGIGTSTPFSPLHVQGTENDGTDAPLRIVSGIQTMLLDGNEIDASSSLHLNHNSISDVSLVDGGGNVGIGTLAPGNYKLKIVHGSNGLNIQNEGTNNNDWELRVSASVNGNLNLFNNDNYRGTFNGTTGVYSSVSDIRLKHNIVALESVLDRVTKLEATRYQFIDNNSENKETIGFIAQDVSQLFPELASQSTDDQIEGTYTLDYSGLGVIGIKAIQEQQKIIEKINSEKVALEQRVSNLEEKLNDLMNLILSNK